MANKININQNQLYSASGALDPRFIVYSVDEIASISNAYVGLEVNVVDSEKNTIKKYRIKKINSLTKKPLPVNEGGYELIKEPKDLKYLDGTPFLNEEDNINPDPTINPLPSHSSSDNGKVLGLDNNGNPSWVSQPNISGKADKVTGSNLINKLVTLDANGNIQDSGITLNALREELDEEYVQKPSTDPTDGQILSYDKTNETTKWIDNTTVHIKYAANITPSANEMHDSIQPGDFYIGIYSDNNSNASTNYSDYQWSQIIGKSALQIYNKTYNTNLNEADFINVLKQNYPMINLPYNQTAAEQQIGTAFSQIDTLSASSETVGKLYLMPNDGDNPTNTILFVTVQTPNATPAEYKWYNLGELNIPSNILTESNVDGTGLANPATDALAKAKDTALLNAKVGDMEYTEVKAENYTPVSGKVQGDGTIAPHDTALYAEIPVDTYDGARFLGVNLANSSNTTTKNTGFCFGHYEDGAFVVDESKYYSATAASSVNKEYTVAKPSGATHIRVNVKYSTLTQSTFYCYLYNGKNIATSIKDIEKQLIIYTEKKSVRVNGLNISESTSQVIESSNNAIRYYLARKGERTRCYAREDSKGRIRAATSTEVPEVGTAVNIKLFGTNKHKDTIAAGTILYDIVPDVDTYILYQTSVAYVDNVVYDVEGTIGDIVARLESNSGDEADQTEKLFAASKFTDKHSNPYKESLTLLHFSDIHGATNNLQRIVDYNTKWSEYIDGMICTGDMVANTYADGNIFVNSNVAGSENVMLVIGNHDTGQLINGAIDWFAKIDTQDAYDRYMGNSASWGIVQPSGAGEYGYYPCYYYKDYAAKKVRLIVLDLMKMVKDLDDGVQDENNLQLAWFTSTINDAITLGYHVMVAEHFPFIVKSNVYTVNAEAIQSDFTLLGHAPSGIANGRYDRHRGEALDKLSAIVEGFKSNGGRFVCWLCGHTHYDHFDRVLNTDQKVIVIGTASIVNDKNTIRNADDESADLFNVLSVNTYNRVVKVFRVGSHLSPALQRIETMSFEY